MLTIPTGRQFWEMESDKLMSEVNANAVLSALVSSEANTIRKNNDVYTRTKNINPASDSISDLELDKSLYSPNDIATLTVYHTGGFGQLNVKILKYGTQVNEINTITLPGVDTQCKFLVPGDDNVQYVLDVTLTDNNSNTSNQQIALNVSSDWKNCPIYGFLGNYDSASVTDADASGIIQNLRRHHVNGIQFYDWYDREDVPIRFVDDVPNTYWRGFMDNPVFEEKIRKYIDLCHDSNMKAMFYLLAYGIQPGISSSSDLQKSWVNTNLTSGMYLYKDTGASENYKISSASDYQKLDLILANPLSEEWQLWLTSQIRKVFARLNWDGWHIDQLGNFNSYPTLYNSVGTTADWGTFGNGFGYIITDAHNNNPDKRFVMNAVDDYGSSEIAGSGDTDFLYSEVWGSIGTTYQNIANYIKQTITTYKKNLVLAAYMNRGKSGSSGVFNTPAVLLTDAVIFGNGASHIELGEHMLCNEYFPNSNLSVSADLQNRLLGFYDSYVSVLNFLHGAWGSDAITSSTHTLATDYSTGKITFIEKESSYGIAISLINFIGTNSDQWRDDNQTQAEPTPQSNIQLKIAGTCTYTKAYIIHCDSSCKWEQTSLSGTNGAWEVTVDSLRVWDVVVLM
jgi:dextranase